MLCLILSFFAELLGGSWELDHPVYMCFVNLEKVYDPVPRGILWRVLREYRVPEPLLRAIWSLYNQSNSCVCILGTQVRSPVFLRSNSFTVSVGVHQGCPFSPDLFVIFMDRIPRRSCEEESIWFVNHRVASMLFADYVVLCGPSAALQCSQPSVKRLG